MLPMLATTSLDPSACGTKWFAMLALYVLFTIATNAVFEFKVAIPVKSKYDPARRQHPLYAIDHPAHANFSMVCYRVA
jgi:hypothetical protein